MIKVEEITLDGFDRLLQEKALETRCPFVLPCWLESWFSVCGVPGTHRIIRIRDGTTLLGVAPLAINDGVASFLGDEDLCDYQDVILGTGDPSRFLLHLLRYLATKVSQIRLGALLPDSAILAHLPAVCTAEGLAFAVEEAGSLSSLVLPKTNQFYLDRLTGKHRHELRRKERRLEEQGEVSYRLLHDKREVEETFQLFLRMFPQGHPGKQKFLTETMSLYFHRLAVALSRKKMMRLGTLSLNGEEIAITFGFEYQNEYYLYNNSYDENYKSLSVGILSKYFAITRAIALSNTMFHFLKGEEKYKRDLGGRETPLKRMIIYCGR